jgi:excisionase family DNA binding protein
VPTWLTPAQVAELLQVPELTLQAWRYHGTGPKYAKVGKHVRYRRAEVDRWLAQQEQKASAGAP